MDDNSLHGPGLNPDDEDPARYSRVARLVSEALLAANQATLEPVDPNSRTDLNAEPDGLLQLPGRVPWLDVVADLAVAAGYLADVPVDADADLPIAADSADPEITEPGRRCLAAIQAAAGTLDGLPGPRGHRDVMVRIALTGAMRGAQVAERPR
jgi:hypothetical protein